MFDLYFWKEFNLDEQNYKKMVIYEIEFNYPNTVNVLVDNKFSIYL